MAKFHLDQVKTFQPHAVCVDLDGTLVLQDTLWILIKNILHTRPFSLFFLAFIYFFKGRAGFKHSLSSIATLDPLYLVYNEPLLAYLRQIAETGNYLVLITGANIQVAHRIAHHLNLFHMVLGSTEKRNLVGKTKATLLCHLFGAFTFTYAGNSWQDVPVWKKAAQVIIINASKRLIQHVQQRIDPEKIKIGPPLL